MENIQKINHLPQINGAEFGIVSTDIDTVVDQVGEFDGFCPCRCHCRVVKVNFLSEGAITITGAAYVGKLHYQRLYPMPEFTFNIFKSRRGVFHRVMQPGGGNRLLIVRNHGHKIGNPLQVDVIGLESVFAELVYPCMGIYGVIACLGGKFWHDLLRD